MLNKLRTSISKTNSEFTSEKTQSKKDFPLHKAVEERNISQLNNLIQQRIDLEEKNSKGYTAVHLAAELGYLEILQILYKAQTNLKAVTLDGKTALHLSAIQGHIDVFEWLWVQGLDLLQKCTSNGGNVFHYAVNHGKITIVKKILSLVKDEQKKLLIEGTDKDGKKPIHYAVFQTNIELINLLIQEGVDLNVSTRYGYTPLHFSARQNQSSIMQILRKAGAKNCINVNGDYPIHLAQQFGSFDWINDWYFSEYQLLESLLTSELKSLLREADASFIKSNTVEMLGQPIGQYLKIIELTLKESKWELMILCLLRLSDAALHKAFLLKEQFLAESDLLRKQDKKPAWWMCYAEAAKYASAAEVIFNQKKIDFKFNVFTPERFLEQQKRIQIHYLREVFEYSDAFPELPALFSNLHRERLRNLRFQLQQDLPQAKYSTEFLLKRLTDGFIGLVQTMLKPCIETLGKPPCRYAFLGLGSMARGEMSPYSDLEFAIVLDEKATPADIEYFRHLTRLFELQVITLRESKFKNMPPVLNNLTPSGFSFDDGGNTPLGKEGLFELIGTPEQLTCFQYMGKFKGDIITSNILKNVCCLAGDATLVNSYETYVKKILNNEEENDAPNFSLRNVLLNKLNSLSETLKMKNIFDKILPFIESESLHTEDPLSMTLRQEQALELLGEDIREFAPEITRQKAEFVPDITRGKNENNREEEDNKEEEDRFFNIKMQLYRLPSSVIQELCLFYGISAKGTWERLKELNQKKYLSEGGLKRLSHLFDEVLRFRLKAHLLYQQEKESLYHPKLEEPMSSEKLPLQARLVLKVDELDKLVEFHKVLLPILAAAKKFFETKGREAVFWQEKDFYDDSLLAQAIIAQKKFDYQKAEECYEKALALNPNDIQALNSLGNLKEHLGKKDGLDNKDGRIDRLTKALKIAINLKGANSIEALQAYSNLGLAYFSLGDYQKAIEFGEKASSFLKEQVPSTSFAIVFNNVGLAYKAIGLLDKALDYFERALGIFLLFSKNESNAEIAMCYSNISFVYEARGDYQEALEYGEKALKIRLEIYTKNVGNESKQHPDLALSYNNLASIYKQMGETKKAIELYSKAEEIYVSLYGKNHPDIALIYNNLAGCYEGKETAIAIEKLKKAKEIYKACFGKEHIQVFTTCSNLGVLYQELKNHAEAEMCYKEALDIGEKKYSQNHLEMGTLYENIGALKFELKKYKEAIADLETALKRFESVEGENGIVHKIAIYTLLGLAYKELGEHSKVYQYSEKIDALQPEVKSNHPVLKKIESSTLSLRGKSLSESPFQKNTLEKELRNAARKNNIEKIETLLDKVDVNAQDHGRYNRTALHWAVEAKSTECIHLLLKFNARIDLLDKAGETVLDLAYKQGNNETIKLLIAAKYNLINRFSSKKDTHYPETDNLESNHDSEKKLRNAAKDNDVKQLEALLPNIDVNAQDHGRYNRTALHWAVEQKSIECIHLLLKFNAKMDLIDKERKTALDLAYQQKDIKIIKLLIYKKYEIIPIDNYLMGQALIFAVHNEETRDIEFLTKKSGLSAREQTSAFTLSEAYKLSDGFGKQLDNNNYDEEGNKEYRISCLFDACSSNISKFTSFFKPSDINLKNERGLTLLHCAIYYQKNDIIQFLLKEGANVLIKENQNGDNPLHYLLKTHIQRLDLAKLLVEKKPEILHECNDRGDTPLQIAVKFKSLQMVEYFLSKGANVNARIPKKSVPSIFLAIKTLNVNMVELLLRYDVNFASTISTVSNSFFIDITYTPLQYIDKLVSEMSISTSVFDALSKGKSELKNDISQMRDLQSIGRALIAKIEKSHKISEEEIFFMQTLQSKIEFFEKIEKGEGGDMRALLEKIQKKSESDEEDEKSNSKMHL